MDFTVFFREIHVGRGCWGHHFMAHNWIHFGLDPTLQVKLQRWFSKEQTLGCWVKWHTFCFLSAFIAAKSWLISTPHCSYRQNRKTPVSDRHRFSETLRTLPIQCCFPSGYRICHALDQVRYIKTQNLPATIRTWIKSNSWRFRYQSSSVVIMYFNYFIRSINRLVSRKLHGGFLSHKGSPRHHPFRTMGFSMTYQPFEGTSIYGNPHILTIFQLDTQLVN